MIEGLSSLNQGPRGSEALDYRSVRMFMKKRIGKGEVQDFIYALRGSACHKHEQVSRRTVWDSPESEQLQSTQSFNAIGAIFVSCFVLEERVPRNFEPQRYSCVPHLILKFASGVDNNQGLIGAKSCFSSVDLSRPSEFRLGVT